MSRSLFRRLRVALITAVLPLVLCSCAARHYAETPAGALHGKVTIEWYKPNLFVFHPDSSRPFSFTRHNGVKIEPGEMYTDGGSIPREFWVFRNYSPWGYGPAFVIHDWLFHQHNCNLPGYELYTIKDAAGVMSEVMKTLMETPGFNYGSKSSMYLMYEAVQTPPAIAAWEHGQCQKPSPAELAPANPAAVFVVDIP